MLALARKRRAPVAERIDPPAIEEMRDTPLTIALRELVAMAQRDGIHAAAAKLEADPGMLHGLARAVMETSTTAAICLWQNAQQQARGTHSRYGQAMDAMGLSGFAYPEEFLNQYQGRPNFPTLHFRLTYGYKHPSGREMPAAVVPILSQTAQMVGCVLLFIEPDFSGWAKAKTTSMVIGNSEGCVIPLRAITRDHLAVCATFETLGKAGQLGSNAWVTITADNLARHFVPPETLRSLLIIYDDHERESAFAAAKRIHVLNPYIRITLLQPVTEKVDHYEGD